MTIQRILPAARYSEAVIVNGLIFCAGMVPENSSDDATLQTEDVLGQIDALLAQKSFKDDVWRVGGKAGPRARAAAAADRRSPAGRHVENHARPAEAVAAPVSVAPVEPSVTAPVAAPEAVVAASPVAPAGRSAPPGSGHG